MVAAGLLVGCTGAPPDRSHPVLEPPATPAGHGTTMGSDQHSAAEIDGIIVFVDVEGGCWAIDTPAGRIQPFDLPAEFRVDGRPVWMRVQEFEGLATTCQVGPLVILRSIRERRP